MEVGVSYGRVSTLCQILYEFFIRLSPARASPKFLTSSLFFFQASLILFEIKTTNELTEIATVESNRCVKYKCISKCDVVA